MVMRPQGRTVFHQLHHSHSPAQLCIERGKCIFSEPTHGGIDDGEE